MSDDGTSFGFLLGFIVGIAGTLLLSLSVKIGSRRSLKEYLWSLKIDDRKMVEECLNAIYVAVEDIAIKTNTRLLKTLHNDFLELQSYLKQLWKQN